MLTKGFTKKIELNVTSRRSNSSMLGWLGFILLYAFFFVIIYYYTPGTGRVSTGPRSQCLLTELTPHLITEPKPLLYTSRVPVLSFKTRRKTATENCSETRGRGFPLPWQITLAHSVFSFFHLKKRRTPASASIYAHRHGQPIIVNMHRQLQHQTFVKSKSLDHYRTEHLQFSQG